MEEEKHVVLFFIIFFFVTEPTSVHCNDLHGVSAVLLSVQGLHGL